MTCTLIQDPGEGIVNLVVRRSGWDDRQVVLEVRRGWLVGTETPSYRGFRFPVEIISHGVWLYYNNYHSKAVGRLIAALGQGLLYYTVNNAASDPTCRFNPKEAAEALTGLGIALTAHPGDGSIATIAGNVLAWTKDALTAFRDNLAQQQWSSCPCGQDCGQHVTDAAVLRAVRDDLHLLPNKISA